MFDSGIISGGPLVALSVDEPTSSSRFAVVSSTGFVYHLSGFLLLLLKHYIFNAALLLTE